MLKAIDTAYKGHLFRSRLEARWAVFFDALGLQWEYEVEGYDLDGVWYLPDFKIRRAANSALWVEVKPKHIEEDQKFDRFSSSVSWPDSTLLVSGTPSEYTNHWGAPYLQNYLQLDLPTSGFLRGPAAKELRAAKEIEKAALRAQQARFEHGAHGG